MKYMDLNNKSCIVVYMLYYFYSAYLVPVNIDQIYPSTANGA